MSAYFAHHMDVYILMDMAIDMQSIDIQVCLHSLHAKQMNVDDHRQSMVVVFYCLSDVHRQMSVK